MERSIEEKFQYKDIILEVVEAKDEVCLGCYFYEKNIECNILKNNIIGYCCPFNRNDKKYIIFKKVKE